MREMFYYATSEEQIKFAAKNGVGNVVIDSRGHGADKAGDGLNDDQLCLMPKYKKIYNVRKKFKKDIDAEIKDVTRKIRLARKLGLKPYMHSYEISFPLEIRKCYPELFVKQTEEARKIDPLCEPDRYLCLSDERVRQMIADKIEEVLSNVPDLAGYIYSFHESQLTTFGHFCDRCKKLPRHKLVEWLYNAVKEGAGRADKSVKVMPRLWGVTHPKGLFYKNQKDIAEIIEHDKKRWMCRRLPVTKKYHYDPDKVNPKLGGMIAKDGNMLVYKATWGDYTLNQPYNKWACSYGKAKQVVELSFEHCVLGRHIPLVISKQHQDMINKMKRPNVAFCAVPVNWGRVYGEKNKNFIGGDPGKWGLNFLNSHNVLKLMKNPDISLVNESARAIKEKYGESVSSNFAELLLNTADVLDKAVNVRGVSSIMNLDYLLSKPTYRLEHVLGNTFWYKCMRKDGGGRISTSGKNMSSIFAEKDEAAKAAVELADAAAKEIAGFKSAKLKKDAKEFFENFRDLAVYVSTTRKRLWIQLKIQKERKASYRWTSLLDELIDQEKVLLAGSKYLQGIYNGTFNAISGW